MDICHRCCPVFLSGQAGPALHWPSLAGLSGDFQMRAEPAGFSAGFEGFSGRLAGLAGRPACRIYLPVCKFNGTKDK